MVKEALPEPSIWAEVIIGIVLGIVVAILRFILKLLTALFHKLNEDVIVVDAKKGFVFRPSWVVNLSLCISNISQILVGVRKRLLDWQLTKLNRTKNNSKENTE